MSPLKKKADWWERNSGITSIKFEFYEDQKNIRNYILLYNIENFIKDFNEYNKKISTQSQSLNNKRLIDAIEEFTALIPPKHEKIVSIEGQRILKVTPYHQIGRISFELKKDIYYFTISGEISPNMYHPPFIRSQILSCPPDTPKCSLRYGTGTVYDFNIHIKSMEYEKKMPAGLYVIEYSLEDPLAFEAADDDNNILGFPDDDEQ
ncbi:hypothetical protein [uncultured Desulfovibrio sp.]|uniref:hypothetical protein n=1 Tax=uncultured Desulfovibrio sp. TaxID=167968 RepID=UPI0026315290|nr:hypothetical protein [uncultured Desulfovibrio sp.]